MAYHRKTFNRIGDSPDPFLHIFSEFDFYYPEKGCDFFCPECRLTKYCMAYEEFVWECEKFYM